MLGWAKMSAGSTTVAADSDISRMDTVLDACSASELAAERAI